MFSKKYTLINRNNECPLCGEKKYKKGLESITPKFLRCHECGTYSIDPMLSPHEIEKLSHCMTSEFYLNITKQNQHYDPGFQKLAYKEFLNQINKYQKTKKLLDIGCGFGSFLLSAKEEGWNAIGIELSESAKVAQSNGLNVIQSNFSEINFSENSFDVVTLFDVIEHIPAPIVFINQINKILRPGGVILIVTPNISGISSKLLKKNWLAYTQKDHVILYSPKTLSNLLSKYNFTIESVKTHDIFLSEFHTKKGKYTTDDELRKKEQIRKRKLISALVNNRILKFFRYMANLIFSLSGTGDRIILFAEKSLTNSELTNQ